MGLPLAAGGGCLKAQQGLEVPLVGPSLEKDSTGSQNRGVTAWFGTLGTSWSHPRAVPAAPWLNLPRREFPLHAHHQISFHGNKSKKASFFFADNVWGLSGHVLAVDKESAAEIGTKAAHFTPRLAAFVTHLGVVQSHGAQPQPAGPFLQETSLSGL